MILAAAVAVACSAVLGPWNLTIPIDGLSCHDGPELQRRLDDQFANRKASTDERLVLRVSASDGIATITVDCPGTLRLTDLAKALAGSRFAVRPETWELYGRVGFEWTSRKPLGDDEIAALRKDLATFADVIEVMDLDAKTGTAYHLHVRFSTAAGAKGIRTSALTEVLRVHGIADAVLVWERWPHMPWDEECGARRVAAPVKAKSA
ncbi:MAG: hypothetical protein HYR85_09570 [Planctomycetes bacterium]|nr:hypothetical protein [Planctomycetota bacterium]MBI3845016.1 hypothetical protein [Planctomycetota bacterium]